MFAWVSGRWNRSAAATRWRLPQKQNSIVGVVEKKPNRHNTEKPISRSEVGGWISGHAQRGQWAGEHLGMPETGPGSMARLGRRIGGLWIDWLLALAISTGFFAADPMVTVWVFALENLILVATLGHTIGHRIMGLHVVRLDHSRMVGIWRALARTVLICLVIPAVVWDADGRGLHDRLSGTAIIKL